MADWPEGKIPKDTEGVFSRMRADHRNVLEDITQLESSVQELARAGVDSARAEPMMNGIADRLETQFETHMRTEDEVLFDALELALPTTQGSIAPLRSEHGELRAMLKDLRTTLARPGDPGRNEQLAVRVQDFVDLLRIHIRKEESLVFSVAERLLRPQELDRISARLSRDQADPSDARRSGPRRKGQIDEC